MTGTLPGKSCTFEQWKPAGDDLDAAHAGGIAVPRAISAGATDLRRHCGRRTPVLLIDEIDRADDEFEAFLLEVLSTFAVTIPEYGEVGRSTPPMVVLTSNRTPGAARCAQAALSLPLDRPSAARPRGGDHPDSTPDVSAQLAAQVASAVQRIRISEDILKPPGVAESLDWARALQRLGYEQLDVASAARDPRRRTQHREDAERVRRALAAILAR